MASHLSAICTILDCATCNAGRADNCVACGTSPTITEATLAGYDYAAFTGQASADDGAPPPLRLLPADQRLTAQALADGAAGDPPQQRVVLDVRPAAQFAIGHLKGAQTLLLASDIMPSLPHPSHQL